MRVNKFCVTYFLLLTSTLYACGNNFTKTEDTKTNLKISTVKNIVLDLGEGNISFTTKLNINSKNQFKTKANANGVFYGNWDNVDVFITKNQANPIANIDYTYNLSSATITATSGTIQFTFKGLKPNTTYYLGAKALSGTTNITAGDFSLSSEILVTTQDGSDAVLQNDISNIGLWDLSIKTLPNTIGAKIDSNIVISDGKDSFALKEQLVNKNTTQQQKEPNIFVNNTGEGLSVFTDYSNGSETSIMGTFINDYIPDGKEFRIDSTGGGVLTLPKPIVAINDFGYGMVLWNNATQINYTRIKNYAPSTIGGEVNQIFDASNNPKNPKVVMQKSNNVGLVVYENTNEIVGKFLDGTGTPNFSGSVNPSGPFSIAPSGNINPDVSNLSNTDSPLKAVVVFNSSANTTIKGALLTNITSSGLSPSPVFTINQNSYSYNAKPKVAVNSLGNGLIVWQANNGQVLENRILVRRVENAFVTGSSVLSGAEFKADPVVSDPSSTSSSPLIDQTNPTVFVDDNGNGLIVWVEKIATGHANIRGIRIHNYTPSGRAFTVNSYIATYGSNASPNLSINELGLGNAVWEGNINTNSTDNPDIYSIRLRDFYPQ